MAEDPEALDDKPIGCCPLFRRNTVTLIAAGGKIGKTSMMAEIIATDIENGVAWLIITEEAPARWKVRWSRYPVLAKVPTVFRQDNRLGWDELCGALASDDLDIAKTFEGVVIDTFTKWADLKEDEDYSASAIEKRLSKLDPIRKLGLAVAVMHHCNKSTGDPFRTIRGTEHYISGVDVVCVMTGKIGSPAPRTIHVGGREFSPALPAKLTVTRDAKTGRITISESETDATEEKPKSSSILLDWTERVHEALVAAGPRGTYDEIKTICKGGISDWRLRKILKAGVEDRTITEYGAGIKGQPRRYSFAGSPKSTRPNELSNESQTTPIDSNDDDAPALTLLKSDPTKRILLRYPKIARQNRQKVVAA